MAGDGLIWAGIGQGIAAAGSTMGQFLMKDLLAQEDREYKAGSRQEELRLRMEDRERDRELRREMAVLRDGGGSSGGGAAGLKAEDLAPGGKLAGMMAGNAGMTEPEYAKYVAARKTGDMSPFMQETTDTYLDNEYGEQKVTSKALPKGFEEEYAAKIKTISKLEEQYALGTRYDDVAKGRQTEFATGVGQGILSGKIPMGKGSGAVAGSEGKPVVNVEGGEKYNQYTGESETTPVGKSQITQNLAQAGQAGALAKKYGKDIEKIDAEIQGGMFNKNSSEKLTSVINSANATIKSLNEGGKGSTPEAKADWQRQYDDAVAIRDRASTLQKGALDMRETPKPGAESGAMPEPKSASEVARLKPGTRFKAPDGSIRIR